ncbi:hypothetical protein [Microseira sp. BLCC-F43]|uniref:hypothetical protein n=1 Tax=Microseira sp. BLCC-F43 TaxID=3153602 RepID=UPI0035B84919
MVLVGIQIDRRQRCDRHRRQEPPFLSFPGVSPENEMRWAAASPGDVGSFYLIS